MNIDNNIFIHVALLPRWEEILFKFLKNINDSGLINKISNIHINFSGKYDNKISELNNYFCKLNISLYPNLQDYELPTLKKIYDFSLKNKNSNILYLHTKGVGKQINLCIEDWVNYEIYFLIEKHQLCLDMIKNYNTVGVDLRKEPTLHYSGNFWWSKSSYISTLPDPFDFSNINKYPNPLNSQRHNQEFWICYNSNTGKSKSLWDCKINVYERHLHRYEPYKYINNL
jgi:hypothetical protein